MFYPHHTQRNKKRFYSGRKADLRLPNPVRSKTPKVSALPRVGISNGAKGNLSLTGFTLMELMIGAGVLIIALVGLVAAFTGCFALGESARSLTIAINDAQCVMEEVRDRNIPSLITNEDWASWAAAAPPDGGGCTSLNNESIEVTYPAGIGANPLQVMVTIHWTERGRERSAQVVTLVTER